MHFDSYSLTILQTIGSVGIGMLITAIDNRKKSRAETLLAQAQTHFTSIDAYSTMLGDLRTQLNMQGDQIKNQAAQILNLQKKENEYVRIIKANQTREREYINKIKALEKTLKETEEMLKELQIKLGIQ